MRADTFVGCLAIVAIALVFILLIFLARDLLSSNDSCIIMTNGSQVCEERP